MYAMSSLGSYSIVATSEEISVGKSLRLSNYPLMNDDEKWTNMLLKLPVSHSKIFKLCLVIFQNYP